MTRALVLNVLSVKTIKLMVVSFVFFVLFAVAMPAPARAAALTSAQIQSILSLLQSFGADQSVINKVSEALSGTSGPSGGSFPGADLDISVIDANSFVAHVKLGQWTNYTYQLDWGEGESDNAQSVRSRLVTVCNSLWTCSNPPDFWHDYATPGYYNVYLYAVKEGAGRTLVEASSVRAGEEYVAPAAPTIHKFIAEPERPTVGQTVMLYWTSSGAQNCHVFGKMPNGGSFTVETNAGTNGTAKTSPEQEGTYEYVLSCYGPSDGSGKDSPSTEKNITVTVGPTKAPATPTISLSATPTHIVAGERAVLKWTTSNANRCVVQYGRKEDQVATAGTLTVAPTETTSYKFICVNDLGTGKDGPQTVKSVTVTVGRVPAPTCRLIANKDRIEKGQSVTLTWVSANADYASQKGGGYGPAQGSIRLTPDVSKTYVKTVYGKGGSAKCTVDVKVEGSSFNDRKETVYNTNNVANQILAAVVSAPSNFIARLVAPRTDASEAQYRALKARNMASSTEHMQKRVASSTDDRKGPKEVPPGLDKNKFPGASACGFLMRNLKRGMSGDDVKKFQEYLRSTGDLTDEATGYFGIKTEEALKKIQARQQIVQTGTAETTGFGAAGPRTRMALMAHCKALIERRDNGSATSTKPVSTIDKTVAPTCTLTASKSEVAKGEEVTLTWESTNATHASMPGGYKGPANGSLTVKVHDTTTFLKRVYNPGNEGSCTASVVVTGSDDAAVEKVVQQTESVPTETVVAEATPSVLDRVFESAGQTLAAAITAYLGLFNIKY
jgi:plastocyanin